MQSEDLSVKKSVFKENFQAYLFVLPALALVMLVIFYPIYFTFKLSMSNFMLQFPVHEFIGLKNYLDLFSDPRFFNAVYVTLFFTFFTVLLEFSLGFITALVANIKFKGCGYLRTALLIPWAIPTVISTMLWRFMLNDQFGVVNYILQKLMIIKDYMPWLGTPDLAIISAIIIDVWKTTPFMFILLLSGLQVIPAELREASVIDGATAWQHFRMIVLPMMRPTILIALLFRTMDAFRVFDMIVALTNGGPANSTEVLSLYSYKTMYRTLDFGYGSAIANTIFLFVAIIAAIYVSSLLKNFKDNRN